MFCFLLALLVASCCGAQPRLPLEFDTDPGWEPRPTFLGNPADDPEIIAADGHVTLRVAEPGKGMKFELRVKPFDAGAVTYLVMRYKTRNLAGGYAIWVYDGSPGGRQVLGTDELTQDGQWHVIALDLWARGTLGAVRSIVTEVQCRAGPASISLDYLRLSDEVPEGATVIPKDRPPEEEILIRPATLELQAEPDWLGKDADAFGAEDDDGALRLYAEGADKGMKWSVMLPEPVDLGKFRFATVRYRARNTERWGDYFIWLGSEGGGMPQESVALIPLSQVRAEDTWQAVILPITEAFVATNMALQVSSAEDRGEAWIDYIRFTTRRPLIDIADVLPVAAGWGDSALPEGSFKAVDLSEQADTRAQARLRGLGLSSWFPEGKITVRGIPFELLEADENALGTPLDIEQAAGVTVGERASEAYLLLAGRLPAMDAARMGKPQPMDHFANPERFVLQVEYEDGVIDEMFPVCVGSGRYEVRSGPEVYCLTGLRPEGIRSVSLRNRMDSAWFLLAGVTLNQGKPVTEEPHVTGLPAPSQAREEKPGQGKITPVGDGYAIENDLIRLELKTAGGIALRAIENRCLRGGEMRIEAGPLFEVGVRRPDNLVGHGETLLTSEEILVGQARVTKEGSIARLVVPVDGTPKGVPLRGELVVTVGEGPDIGLRLDLTHVGDEVFMPVINFPLINGIRIGSVEDTWYLWCRKGGIVNNLPIHQRQHYGGEYPLQVADVFNPQAGGGLALLTYDLADIYRSWDLRKDEAGVSWRMDYWQREYQPGERIEIAPTALRAHTGDWRRALEIYRDWAHSWHKLQVPRKKWFQGVFYYQQTNAWTRLHDPKTGQWRMAEEVKLFRDYFGRLDYLHIFDFGQSKVYGRVGDYNHYEELGGLEVMRAAIKEAQDMGVPIGLYIEGYLCDERGVWGSENVLKYDIRKKDGNSLLWGGAPAEHMMCPASEGWRDHLAATYKRVARELKPSGMYIDQYGFINTWKTCHSREHGHPVPWAPIRGERDTTKAIRASVPTEIATLTEETPNDVNSQYQDGGLGYSVTQSDPGLMPHRVDLFRFVFPSFKVFQLVQYNAFVEGGWQLLKFPFFNGEGYWLGGRTSGTYCEDAHQFLRKAFAILNDYEDAFCSDDVAPLIPTLKPTVYANRFSSEEHTVWTLFNAEYRTFRGDCLRVAHEEGTRYVDAFSGDEIDVRIEGGVATIPVELGPRAVGCVVAGP